MNLLKLIELCEARTGFNDTTYRTTWQKFLNDGIREYARRYPWPGLEDLMTVSTDGTEFLILPHFVDTVVAVLNKSQNVPVDRTGDWDRESPAVYAQRTLGTVYNYDDLGQVAALRDPTSYIYYRSTHILDVVSDSVYITGYVNNSGASGTAIQRSVRSELLSITGVSPVTAGELYTSILSISKLSDLVGDLYFYDSGDSNRHLSLIPGKQPKASFKRIQLRYKPAAKTDLLVRFRHSIPPLSNDAQGPHPSVDTDFVVRYAIGMHWRGQHQYTKAQIEGAEATGMLQDIANKQLNFDEPWQQVVPWTEGPDAGLD